MTKSAERTLTVGLLWHSITSDNLGVGALTLSQMAIITEAASRVGAQVRFVVIGTQGKTPYPIQAFEIVNCVKFSLRSLQSHFDTIRLLRQCDIVFDIGEGDSFANIYGNRRLLTQVISKVLVRLLGKQLILSPQTIGPFNSVIGKCLGKIGLCMAKRIYARDHLSMQYLAQMKCHNKSEEVIDVAFALPFDRSERDNETPMQIGINVSGLLYNGGYSGRNELGLKLDYPALIEGICKFFLARSDIEVYLVHHVFSDTAHIENDLHVNLLLQEHYPRLRLAPKFRSPMEAKSFISGLDFFTGARMHSCIAAFSSGVPTLPMAYSRKFNGLFNSLNYTHVLDCLALDTQSALQMFIHAFDHRDQLAVDLNTGNKMAQEKLKIYTDQVSELLAHV
jgi:polysaccharide pyruvyl transferase WcaK-like protein